MISQSIGAGAQVILRVIIKILVFLRINPNHLTFLGFVMSIVTAYTFARGRFGTAGVILIIAGLFDMVDGMVARNTNSETPFGAFFDSVMDRYSDLIMYLGLIIWYGQQDRMTYVVLVGVVMMGSVMTSYTRARAESLIPQCKVGFLERPERIVLLIIGSFYYMDPIVWVIAVLSNWTVVHRILYTRARMMGRPAWVIAHQREETGDRRQKAEARKQKSEARRVRRKSSARTIHKFSSRSSESAGLGALRHARGHPFRVGFLSVLESTLRKPTRGVPACGSRRKDG